MRAHGYIAFIVGICLTAWTCVLVSDVQQAQLRSDFQRDTGKLASDTNVRLQTYFDMLLSLKGMFAVKPDAGRADFARFVRALNLTERYPGFQAIQFVRYVPAERLAAYALAVRRDDTLVAGGYPGFAVHPPVQRADHYIVEFNEPMSGNENAFGLDLAALPPHLAAVAEGRDSGSVIATERINLVQDSSGEAGFVARAPVYRAGLPLTSVAERRAALVGLVAIVFRVNNLMREVIEPGLLGHLRVHIVDATGKGAGQVMFDSIGAAPGGAAGMTAATVVHVAQRQWRMNFEALPGSRYSRDLTSVLLIGVVGLVISTLLAAQLMASRRSRELAERLRATLDEQRAFQDSASVGIALFAHGVVMRCNRGMEEIMGYWPGELDGRPTALLSQHGEQADPFAVDARQRRWQSELELRRKDGSAIWCLVNGKALDADDLSKGGVWVVQDISDRKHTEAALVDAKDGLETSLAELARQKRNVESAHSDLSSVLVTLKQAQTNLITSEKMASLGSLVAGIAHELNTPIGNSLLTATALADMVTEFEQKYVAGGIKRSALEALLADARLACGIMAGSLRRAADLITSFKQVAVDQTSDKRRRFDLCMVVRDTVATYAAQLRRANCEVAVDGPAMLMLDSYPGSVGQVLSNLINNVLLHAFDGRSAGRIEIAMRELEGGQLLLLFRDDGVGMSSKTLHQVFDPFFTTKMGQGGSGLGMNIVYNIVTGMLGGNIAIESVAGEGTSVTITIPSVAPDLVADEAQVLAS
ncbi:MAG: CHASE domain-containing protein [Pseudomonadota bacterium]